MARKPKLSHLLWAMKAGDVIYVPESVALDRQITSGAFRNRGKVATARFLAVTTDPKDAHRVVRVTMIKPLEPSDG